MPVKIANRAEEARKCLGLEPAEFADLLGVKETRVTLEELRPSGEPTITEVLYDFIIERRDTAVLFLLSRYEARRGSGGLMRQALLGPRDSAIQVDPEGRNE
jgi:hypothetical protein